MIINLSWRYFIIILINIVIVILAMRIGRILNSTSIINLNSQEYRQINSFRSHIDLPYKLALLLKKNIEQNTSIEFKTFIKMNSLLGVLVFAIILIVTSKVVLAVVVASSSLIIPFLVVRIMREKKLILINQEIIPMIISINDNYSVNNDIIESLKKCVKVLESKYIKESMHRIVLSIHMGEKIDRVFDREIDLNDNKNYKYLLMNFKEIATKKCDGEKLLEKLEVEMLDHRQSINQKKAEVERDSKVIMMVILATLFVILKSFFTKDYIYDFYIKNGAGNILLSIYFITFIIGIYLFVFHYSLKE